eukprot:2486900-Alexandrium_andersonii.AAC.1
MFSHAARMPAVALPQSLTKPENRIELVAWRAGKEALISIAQASVGRPVTVVAAATTRRHRPRVHAATMQAQLELSGKKW